MRFLIKYFLFISVLILVSCDKNLVFVNCSDCLQQEPETAELRIKVEQENAPGYTNPTINIYSGILEDNILLGSFQSNAPEVTYTVALNKKYTVTATYITSKATYIAVDSTTPLVKYVLDQCTDPCYYTYNKAINLKLKIKIN